MGEILTKDRLIEGGNIFKTHGYKGELNASLDYNFEAEEILNLPFFFEIDGLPVPFFAESVRKRGAGWLVKFEDVDSDEIARNLANTTFYFEKEKVSQLFGIPEDQLDITIDNYIGFKIIDYETSALIGEVVGIDEAKEYDYLLVRDELGKEHRIPYLDEFLKEEIVSDENGGGELKVSLPEGFLEIN